METNEMAILIYAAIYCVFWGQIEASGNIGNRSYSVWYHTHCLVEKKGVCKWIYFKPKHFDRYTLHEVVSFFASYIAVIVFGILGCLRLADMIHSNTLYACAFTIVGLIFLSTFIIVLINDIGSHRDKKKKFYLEYGEREIAPIAPQSLLPCDDKLVSKVIQLTLDNRNHTYFTIYNLWDSYHVRLKEAGKDTQKRNKVNLDYIGYFKNIKNLKVIKENKSGSLQLKIQK